MSIVIILIYLGVGIFIYELFGFKEDFFCIVVILWPMIFLILGFWLAIYYINRFLKFCFRRKR